MAKETKKVHSKKQVHLGKILAVLIIAALTIIVIILGVAYRVSGNHKRSMGIKEQNLESFNKITLNNFGNVEILQGDQESIKIEANKNLIDQVKTNISDNRLTINYSPFSTIWPFGKNIKIYITVKNLNEINVSGLGQVTSSSLKGDNLSMNITGSGKINIDVDVQKISSIVSGSGNVVLSGTADDQTLSISGSGVYKAKKLKSKNTAITINGAGKAQVNTNSKLDIIISGTGDVQYMGNPIVSQNISGEGKVQRVNN
jgi:hypothetical protein